MGWVSRLFAFITGVALMAGGINLAADVGEILFAVPMLFLGSVQLRFALTGYYPRWSQFGRRRGAPPNER